MKVIKIMFLSVLAVMVFAGCQDISKPPKDPALKMPPPDPDAKPVELDKLMTKQKMTEIYNFIVNIREQLLTRVAQVEAVKDDPDRFPAEKSLFRVNQDEWRRLIKVRMEWLEYARRSDDPHYPRGLLMQAMRKLDQEVQQYYVYFLRGGKVDPKVDEELLDLMEKIRKELEQYEDPKEQ